MVLELRFIKKHEQNFDVSRVVDISKCDCEDCDFLYCPKNNYTPELTRYIYSVDEFIKENRIRLLHDGFTGELVRDFFESCVKYPTDYYYSLNDNGGADIVKLTGSKDKKVATIFVDGSSFLNISLPKDVYVWACKVFDLVKIINKYAEDERSKKYEYVL